MRKNILIFVICSFFIAGCENNNPINENNNHESQTQHSQNQVELEEQEYTKKVLTSGADFHALYPDSGFQFNSEYNVESLKNFFGDQLEYYDLITSISCESLQAREGLETSYLQIGSGLNVGSLTWNSDVKIYSVLLEVCCYSKYDSYHQITNSDTSAKAKIDNSTFDLEGSVEPTFKTFSQNYSEGVYSFTISNNSGRIFVKSLTITWRG